MAKSDPHWAYARREHETPLKWHERVLSCPLLSDLPLTAIADLSGATVGDLELYRHVIRINRLQAKHTTPDPKTDDEYF